MGEWGKRIVILAVIAGGVYWYTHQRPESAPPAAAPAGGAPSGAIDCLRLAETANSSLHSASNLLMRPPVDSSAFGSAESDVSSKISAAESSCAGGSGDRERQGLEEVRAALTGMRATLGDLSSAARGAGGAMEIARRQEEIDAHLDRARSLLK